MSKLAFKPHTPSRTEIVAELVGHNAHQLGYTKQALASKTEAQGLTPEVKSKVYEGYLRAQDAKRGL